MNKAISIAIAAAFILAGCNKEADQPAPSFYNQKNSTVYTYKQNEEKMAYEECLAKHRETHTEGECHVPDFLKK